MVGPVRNGYVHVGVSQCLGHVHTAEPAAHHEHLMPSACLGGQSGAAVLVRHRHRLALHRSQYSAPEAFEDGVDALAAAT
jgi:hypothetical protein